MHWWYWGKPHLLKGLKEINGSSPGKMTFWFYIFSHPRLLWGIVYGVCVCVCVYIHTHVCMQMCMCVHLCMCMFFVIITVQWSNCRGFTKTTPRDIFFWILCWEKILKHFLLFYVQEGRLHKVLPDFPSLCWHLHGCLFQLCSVFNGAHQTLLNLSKLVYVILQSKVFSFWCLFIMAYG
jgi:hypothetical protein